MLLHFSFMMDSSDLKFGIGTALLLLGPCSAYVGPNFSQKMETLYIKEFGAMWGFYMWAPTKK